MSLILLATVCSGFVATRAMLAFRLENVMLRYPLAVIFAYFVFFIAVKLWLKYIAPPRISPKAHKNSADLLGVLPDMPISGSSDGSLFVGEIFRGGGGGFGGGGATGGFDETGSVLTGAMDADGGLGDAVGDVAGDAVSAISDEGGVAAVVVVGVLAAIMSVLIGAGVYLVYEAPFILSEAAFQCVLAAGLIRGTKRIKSADWVGSVFKTTAFPFAVTLALAILTGYLMHRYFPGVTRISELISRL
jgi:hypothetical protein